MPEKTTIPSPETVGFVRKTPESAGAAILAEIGENNVGSSAVEWSCYAIKGRLTGVEFRNAAESARRRSASIKKLQVLAYQCLDGWPAAQQAHFRR